MTMTTAEQRAAVEAVWESEHHDTAMGVLAGPHYIILGNPHRKGWTAHYGHTQADAWDAAYAWHEQRMEEVRQIDEEIALIENEIFRCSLFSGSLTCIKRILASRQSARAELTRGMKGAGK